MSGQEQFVELRDAPPAPATGQAAADAAGSSYVQSARAYLGQVRGTPFVIAVTLFAIFLPAVTVPYGFSDDYPLLWMAVTGEPSVQFGKTIIDAGAINGRPFAGLLTSWFFSAAGSIDNLRFVRLVGVVGIVLVALLLQWALVRSRIRPVVAALMTLLICTMPAFQIYGSWTLLFSVSFAALLAGGASRFVVAAVDGARNLVADRFVIATAMLTASLLTYQPAAMFYWVFFAVALIGAAQNSSRAVSLMKMHFALAGITYAIAYATIKFTVHILGSSSTGAARNTLTRDFGGKIHFFIHGPLYQASNLFDLTPSRWFAALVAIVAAGGTALLLRRQCDRPLLYAGVGLLLIPLCFLPNLVVAENSGTFRVQVALTGLIALYFCLGAMGIWFTARDLLQPRISRSTIDVLDRLAVSCAVVFVAASGVIAAKNVLTLFAEPQMTELRILRSQVAALPEGAPRVAFVQTGYTEGLTKLALQGEYGVPTTTQLFNIEPSLLLILREERRLPPNGVRPTVDIYPWYTTTLPKNEPVIDLRGLQKLR